MVTSLKNDGHDVLYVLEKNPGVTDDEVLLDAYNEKRILITEDKDFGELVYRLKKPAEGIILIRIDVEQRHLKWSRIKKLIEKHEGHLSGHFVVINTQKFRFRPLLSTTE
jgi:predicted nuclease of predicted toxin-antitoxin system